MGKGFFGKHTEETKRKISATKKRNILFHHRFLRRGTSRGIKVKRD
jgi:hypothetical protein